MQAGYYSECFTWLRRSITKDTSNGQDVESFTANGTLWGNLEPGYGQESVDYGAMQAQSDATIVLRQIPTVSALDRLTHKRTGLVYVITGRSADYSKNQLTLQAKLFDDLELRDQ